MSKVSVVKLIAGYELVIAVVWNLYVVMKLEGGAGWEEMAPGGEAMAPGELPSLFSLRLPCEIDVSNASLVITLW